MNNDIKILLLDSNSLVNRAFHALPPLMINDGLYTNAIYGYISMLAKLLNEEKPTHVCAVFDVKAKTFRHIMSEQYKATRKPMAEELAMQIPVLQDLLKKMGIKILYKEGYEADDILGTLAKRFEYQTIIVSGDRDCLQLVDETTTVFNTKKGISDVKKYTPEVLFEEGFTPAQIIEYKGLAGDTSDNISGCPGVGEKTAKELLAKFENIDGIYDNIDSIPGKLKEKLLINKDTVYLSKKLATIETHADIDCKIEDLQYNYDLSPEAIEMMKYLQFKNLPEKFKSGKIIDSDKKTVKNINEENVTNLYKITEITSEIIEIKDKEELIKIINEIEKNSTVNIVFDKECIGISIKKKNYKIITSYSLIDEGLSENDAIEIIKPLFGPDYKKIFFDLKANLHIIENYGINIEMPYDDVLIMAYLINNTKVIKSASQLFEDYGFDPEGTQDKILFLYDILSKKITENNLSELYNNIELPLVKILFEMEKTGFKINFDILEELNKKFTEEIDSLINKIYDIAGETFNINSTKQLAVILFDKLGLKPTKKTKTGYSVDAETLEEMDHPIITEIIRYRELTKLKSTYIEGMKTVMNPITGKVHTSFNQCITATGRLSSTEPNLQNIPVKRQEGREIRKMFVPSLGGKLVTADYSQIELRLLAHFSEEPKLIKAYSENNDIHKLTASKIFNTPMELVTPEMRSSAKAVNFGIIYGISSFGLSKNAGVGRYQAKQFIEQYFETYPKVKEYMDKNVSLAKEQGYLTTAFGRIRHFPELTSSKYNIRAFGERAAMNMPLQGTASDIIKIAMIKVFNALKDKKLKSKLILQVHDELILDAPENEVEEVKIILKECMESAVKLNVPLIVNVASGYNWYEAK